MVPCYNHRMTVTIALDIGGTNMRAAVFPENSEKPIKHTLVTTYINGKTSVDRIVDLIRDVIPPGEEVDAIGIAVPALIDPKQGDIIVAVNLPEFIGVPIPQIIQNTFGVPVLMGNDANLAAMGEWHYGAGKGHQHLVYLTIGTGVGGSVIIEGRLLVGHHGLAPELGHVTVLPDGPLCVCGQRGHLEALVSGTAIAAYVAEQLKEGRPSALKGKPDTKTISQAAWLGDPLAQEAFNRAGHYLGLAIANFIMIFNPSIVILGGGVSQAGELLLNPVQKTVRQSVMSDHFLQDLIITSAALGDDAGLFGALALARDSL